MISEELVAHRRELLAIAALGAATTVGAVVAKAQSAPRRTQLSLTSDGAPGPALESIGQEIDNAGGDVNVLTPTETPGVYDVFDTVRLSGDSIYRSIYSRGAQCNGRIGWDVGAVYSLRCSGALQCYGSCHPQIRE